MGKVCQFLTSCGENSGHSIFNAALSRQLSNKQFIDDKNELWFHVLKLANAQQSNQNLTKISQHVRELVDMMRHDTKESLRQLDIIPLGLNKKNSIN